MNILYPVYSSVQTRHGVGAGSGMQVPAGLPMNILTRIISHVEDLRDVLNITRSSRLFYYLALPRLYEKVTLRSYSDVRRKDGRVEGLGAGSPFVMALSALATSQGSSAVKSLRVEGAWQESDDYMLGRIPDATVLLSIAVRAALDRMQNLDAFIWDLDTKPLRNVYDGLSLRGALRSVTLVCPVNRTPRPIAIVPGIPSLVSLRVTNMDPLCYNDDISYCLLESKNLRELKLHWSARMRLEAECSANLDTVFGKCIEAGYKMSIRNLGLQNFYGPNRGQLYFAMKQEAMVDTQFLDMFGGAHGTRPNVFIDETWRRIPPELNFKWKLHRSNELAMQHTRILRGFSGLEELYLVNKNLSSETPLPNSPMSPFSDIAKTPGTLPGADLVNLGNEYFDTIIHAHSQTLRHLLLFDKFDFQPAQIDRLFSQCPRLNHLGIALLDDPAITDADSLFASLAPRIPTRLTALRILQNTLLNRLDLTETGPLLGAACTSFARYLPADSQLSWLGIADKVYYISRSTSGLQFQEATWDDVSHIGIWGLDNLQL